MGMADDEVRQVDLHIVLPRVQHEQWQVCFDFFLLDYSNEIEAVEVDMTITNISISRKIPRIRGIFWST